ncbi:hypothetical protein NQ314_000907, partial [Rhamnusium bicolor]
VFICLNFFGHGGYQTTVGQDLNLAVSQPVVSRIIRNISNIITVDFLPRYVKFPTTNEELGQVKEKFLETLNFPNVRTQIAITSPNIDDPVYHAVAYLNRKGYHSINVQAVQLMTLLSTIHHHLKRKYQDGHRETWLLGYSGYPLQPWLMTPINDAVPNTPEALYTQRHIHARNVEERGNGLCPENIGDDEEENEEVAMQ